MQDLNIIIELFNIMVVLWR